MKNSFTLRSARAEDAEKLLAIYAPYIEKTAVTFEYTVPDAGEFRERIEKTLQKFPYVVAEKDGAPIGYAYAGTYIPRTACDRACEVSIYVGENFRGEGAGKALYSKLEEILACQNITNVYASVAYADEEDEHLSHKSVFFHKHMGYSPIGHFNKCGFKFGKWYDLIWFEKFIGAHSETKSFIPYPLIAEDIQF